MKETEKKEIGREEVIARALEYFEGDELATKIWIEKYALHDKEGNLVESSPDDTIQRVCKELLRIENKYPNPLSYEEIYDLQRNFSYFIPAGSILYGCGNNYTYSSLANCTTIASEEGYDSYGVIFRNDEELVQLMKRRSGVGLDLSHLRGAGSIVSNAARSSTGVVPFAERYSNSTKEVAQDGRRGALMLTLNVDHPDILDFIKAKTDLSKITGANLSVKINDKFMQGVICGDRVSTKIWKEIIKQAYNTAEPGVLYWDTIVKGSPADQYPNFQSISTNPCSEVPLCAYDSCRLSSINLYTFVNNPFTSQAKFDFDKFSNVVFTCQRFMDDFVDLEEEKICKILNKIESDPESESIKFVEKNLWTKMLTKLLQGRRTGLGVIGLADTLAGLGIKYDSDEAIIFSTRMAKTMAIASYSSSIVMATERGAFSIFNPDNDFNSTYTKRIYNSLSYELKESWMKHGRRNIANMAIAPTGTLSLLSRISSGIEPVFRLSYIRKKQAIDSSDMESFSVLHPKLTEWQKITGETDISKSPYFDSTTDKINQLEKLRLQAGIQKWIDHSISVTYNLPKEVTLREVEDIYFKAWQYGCKGCTIYREGSRAGILVADNTITFKPHNAPKRPPMVEHDIFYPTIKGEKYIVLVGVVNNYPFELFCFKYKDLNTPMALKHGYVKKKKKKHYNLLNDNKEIVVENITSFFDKPTEEFATRMISTSLRHGAEAKFVMEQLDKSEGELYDYNKVIARVLKKYIKEGDRVTSGICPKCSSTNMVYQNGCATCIDCGYSRC